MSAAIISVLRAAGGEMKASEIHRATERQFGGAVSRHTVSDFLITQSASNTGRVMRVRHAYYRIR